MRFRFNQRKAAQAAAYLLGRHEGRLNYMKLIKLMYLADRRVLIERGRMITGDHMVSMPHGPVLSTILNLITEDDEEVGIWSEYVGPPSGYEVCLKKSNAETDELSRYELRVLDEIDAEFGPLGKWVLRDVTHELPEWVDPNGSSLPIEPQTILRQAGRSSEEIHQLTSDAEDVFFMDLRAGAGVSKP